MDTGYHSDQTRAALTLLDEPFGVDAIRIVQVANYFPDFYDVVHQQIDDLLEKMEAGTLAGLTTVQTLAVPILLSLAALYTASQRPHLKQCQFMHFDSLEGPTQVKDYLTNLMLNSQKLLVQAETNKEPLQGLLTLGVILHALQDFCSHSTWVEKVLGIKDEDDPKTVPKTTLFDRFNEALTELKTGLFPNVDENPGDSHIHLNHDFAQRPNFNITYISGVYFSLHFLTTAKGWVQPNFWREMREYGKDRELYLVDFEQTFLTSLYAGHWKGPTERQRIRIVFATLRWLRDSPLVDLFKDESWIRQVTAGLEGPSAPTAALPNFPPLLPSHARRAIEVSVVRAECDVESPQPVVTIDGVEFIESPALGQKTAEAKVEAEPGERVAVEHPKARWTMIHFVKPELVQVKVSIQLKIWDPDPHPFLKIDEDKTIVELFFNCQNSHLSTDDTVHDSPDTAVTVQGSGVPKATLSFFITSRLVGG